MTLEAIFCFGTDCIHYLITSKWSDFYWHKKEQRTLVANIEVYDMDIVYTLAWSWFSKREELYLNDVQHGQVSILEELLLACGDKGKVIVLLISKLFAFDKEEVTNNFITSLFSELLGLVAENVKEQMHLIRLLTSLLFKTGEKTFHSHDSRRRFRD